MEILFSEIPWSNVEERVRSQLKHEIDIWDENRLLNASIDDLCQYFVDSYQINIPVINRDKIIINEPEETEVDVSRDPRYAVDDRDQPAYVPGVRIQISVPFTGDYGAFRYKPAVASFQPPRASISMSNRLIFVITGTDLQADTVRQEFDEKLDIIDSYLDSLRRNANILNDQLDSIARHWIDERRTRLLAYRNLAASIGYTLRQREDSPRTYTAPEVRRRIAPTPPETSSQSYQPEPALDQENYEHILGVIENMAQVMEYSPTAFSEMAEEVLRWHFLVQLNGHYEGQATGETFNYGGKTDILIRSEGKNIFIAECKYWGGPQTLTGAIDQLLGYSSWRDTKVAVIIFNRNKDFTRVLDSIVPTTKEHPNCKRELDQRSETSFPFVFSHRDDVNREMTLTVMAFDVPR
jgi:hypothetical protein